ncbi:MAG: 16S rRNA (cytidine(1402)-2'-O)-methyltransferase [Natronincolaceae bacterium]|nr:16S rRNA (cytidine(1402)-2'-O)-methyltransferase [Bacillota bacterium]NLK90974.1 16S rRNA (cytidine(1402)-2'-O)-methyltransferase [Clostridiales bacterium]
MNKGKLYVCPTPIGNLEDITIRVLNTLKNVDLIAAEDTRHTLKLLNYFGIQKPLTSYHEHNFRTKGMILINKLLEGQNIALVSDAGMPGISDPGSDMVRLCIEREIPLEILPGATAGILALVGSGLDTTRFAFEGFLDKDTKERRERLRAIKKEDRTLIFYEAPHRIVRTLEDMVLILGNRRAVIARELTKVYEEFVRDNLIGLIEHFELNPPKGEIVLLCEGADLEELAADEKNELERITIREHILLFMKNGLDKKSAIREVAKRRNIPKRDVYKESIGL